MKTIPTILTAATLVLVGACRTQVLRGKAPEPTPEAAISSPSRAFEVVERGEVVGIVVEFVERGGERRFFSVRNELHQELGMVDAHGRSWRFQAHQEESAEWLGTGTVLDGAIQILGLGTSCELYEVELEQLAAPPPSPPREARETSRG